MAPSIKDHPTKTLWICGFLLVLLSVASICFGAVSIPVEDLFPALWGGTSSKNGQILYLVRLPRTLGSILAGAGLATSGAIIQKVLGNPLAGPNIIGVNAGAGFAVVLSFALFPSQMHLIPFSAFLGALAAVLLVYYLGQKTGASRLTLVLAGVAVNAFLTAATNIITTFVPDALVGTNTFRVGGFAGLTMTRLSTAGIYILVGLLGALFLTSELDLLSLGEDTAKSLGLPVRRYRFLLLGVAAALAGASVSFAGLLGFVGLIIPHVGRFFMGNDSRLLLPFSMLAGALFTTLCDLLSRLLFAPFELPAGILLSIVGAPVFMTLLFRRKGGSTGD